MSVITMTRGTLSNLVLTYYDRKFIERVESNRVLVFRQFGDVKPLPKREGDTITWTRWNAATKGKLIQESGPGQVQGISASRVSAKIIMIGDHAKITTLLDMVSINSVVDGAIDVFADAAAWTMDFMASRQLLWKRTSVSAMYGAASISGAVGATNTLSGYCECASGTQFQAPCWIIDDLSTRVKAFSALNGASSATLLSPSILRTLKLKLKVKMCMPFEDGYYKAIIHPDLLNQLASSSAFIDLHKYTETGVSMLKGGNLQEGKPGTGVGKNNGLAGVMEGFKFYESTEAPMCSVTNALTSAHGAGRYYFTFFFGKHAYGVTDFDGGLQTIIKTPGPGDTSQPLNQYSTVGYKAVGVAQVLNPSCALWLVSGKPTEVG